MWQKREYESIKDLKASCFVLFFLKKLTTGADDG